MDVGEIGGQSQEDGVSAQGEMGAAEGQEEEPEAVEYDAPKAARDPGMPTLAQRGPRINALPIQAMVRTLCARAGHRKPT